MLNADEFTSYVNTNGTAAQKKLLGTDQTDWQKEIFKTAALQTHTVTARGGSDKMNYFLSRKTYIHLFEATKNIKITTGTKQRKQNITKK